jgi:hypothetical protein
MTDKIYEKLKKKIGQKFQLSFPQVGQEIRGDLEIRYYDPLCNVIHMIYTVTKPEPLTFFYRPVKHLLLDRHGNWMHVDNDQVLEFAERKLAEAMLTTSGLTNEIVRWLEGEE